MWTLIRLFSRSMIHRDDPRIAVVPFRPYDVLDAPRGRLDEADVFRRALFRLRATAPELAALDRAEVVSLRTGGRTILAASRAPPT